ncbi:MAG: hypothetical protein JSV23_09265, partial [Promethearchaeota archaeon]
MLNVKKKLRIKKKRINIPIGIFLILIVFTVSVSFININVSFVDLNNTSIKNRDTPKISAFWASINITNYQLNNTRHLHNDTITIKGNLKYNNGTGVKFTDIAIFVDGVINPQFTNTTNSMGDFNVNFRIPFKFDVHSISGYKIQVNVTDDSKGNVYRENYLIIYANATSIFEITRIDNFPKIPGEDFRVEGFLRYDNISGSGIPNVQINYQWFNSTYTWSSNSFFTNPLDGSFLQDITIPFNAFNQSINLNLSYSGDFPKINNSEVVIPNVRLFSDIRCIWNL